MIRSPATQSQEAKNMSLINNVHEQYHAHIYFDSSSADFSHQLRDQVRNTFGLAVGRFNERLVGPHTKWSFSISFSSKDFDALIPWLEKNRNGHSILVHGVTGNELKDHTDYAYWLGDSIELNLSIFSGNK